MIGGHFARGAVFLLIATAAFARQAPFDPGEVLHYSVRWAFIPVATVRLEVQPMTRIGGEPAYHFSFQVQTFPVVESVYPVTGRIDAFTDLMVSRSLRLEKNMVQGDTPKIFRVDFDWTRGTAKFVNEEGTRRQMRLAAGTLDILSVLYYARTLPLLGGSEIRRTLNDGRKHLAARAQVVGRELVQVGDRSWRAIHIVPDVRKLGGIFKSSPASSWHLWFSDDDRRLPLKLTALSRAGRFTIELTPGTGPAAEAEGTEQGPHTLPALGSPRFSDPPPATLGPPGDIFRAEAS